MDEEKVVIHNGVEMLESWPQQIEEAQSQKTYLIGGEECERVR